MSVTTNLSEFGLAALKEASDLLSTWADSGFPDDFYDEDVQLMLNTNSGNVFLKNSEFQVAMIKKGKLESFYSSPYEGREGFFDELKAQYADMHEEDKEWLMDIAKNIGKEDELQEQ